DLSRMPVEQPLRVTNEIRSFQLAIVEQHPNAYRHDQIRGQAFPSRDFYSRVHPEIQLTTRGESVSYPYFEASRVPAVDELRDRVSPQDVVTRMLVDSGAPVDEIAVALAYTEDCGTTSFQEIYRIRPLWAVYLAATNISETPLALTDILGNKQAVMNVGYRAFAQRRIDANDSSPLPSSPLPPKATAIVPIATLLGPLTNIPTITLGKTRKDFT